MALLATATDLTSTVSSLLVDAHKSTPLDPTVSVQKLDAFLNEARQINRSICDLLSYARAIRSAFLSTAPPPTRSQKHARIQSQSASLHAVPSYLNDAQREEIVSQTTALLHEVSGSIQKLQQTEDTRHGIEEQILRKKYGKPATNFLMKWAHGGEDPNVSDAGKSDEQIRDEGREETLHIFRENVLWYLAHWFDKANESFQEMVRKKHAREAEKKASMLYDSRNRHVKLAQSFDEATGHNGDSAYGNLDMRGKDTYDPAQDFYGGEDEQDLSPEQLQLFEQENSSLMNHYNETLTQVTQVEKSLFEISSLQQTLIGHLEVQGEMIGGLVEDASRTDENVQKGNKELKRATERTSTAKIMYHTTWALCSVLIIWDLIF